MQTLQRDVTPLIKPGTVAVIGASSKRVTQGNVVIQNLQKWGFAGTILPIHPSAVEIDGLPVFASVRDVAGIVDLAVVAIPAAEVFKCLTELEAAGVRSAMVFSNGFSPDDERRIRAFGATSRLALHGPNCMGLINFSDRIPLYPSSPSLRLTPGPMALVAQSGSAAISIMNSSVVGFSTVVTVGSEFQLSTADYVRWLATDPHTKVVGAVVESIPDPVAFALAAEHLHANGKLLIVLKVGNSAFGAAATQAHTGALLSSRDAYDSFFSDCDIATVGDYSELIAAMECAAVSRRMPRRSAIALAGISGGQTALACDAASLVDIDLASFSDRTAQQLQAFLPGTPGRNPVDIGATVQREDRKTPDALRAMLDDPQVGGMALLQDCQASLNPRPLTMYMDIIATYKAVGHSATKPVVMISPTGEPIHPEIANLLAGSRMPVLRGLREGLVALRCMGFGSIGKAQAWADRHARDQAPRNPAAIDFRKELAGASGALSSALCFRILRSYGIPVTRAITVPTESEAIARCGEVGFPMVVKVASTQIAHRSDVGGVVLNVGDIAALTSAMALIRDNIAARAAHAVIDGFELQEQVIGAVEAMAGFAASAPFGSLMLVGSGGTMVELLADRAVALAPVTADESMRMLSQTRLGQLLAGYRNLMPVTDTNALAALVTALSALAHDLGDLLVECDLNPVLVRPGSGAVCVVDALMIARRPS
jgi:acetate---CoA ligase (ADP-forming)